MMATGDNGGTRYVSFQEGYQQDSLHSPTYKTRHESDGYVPGSTRSAPTSYKMGWNLFYNYRVITYNC